MLPPVYVSYYTPKYAEEVSRLTKSLQRFGLNHDITLAEDLGSWLENVRRKAFWVRDALGRFPMNRIIWLDADAEVLQYPDLFDGMRCDFAQHRHRDHCCTGTLFFGNSVESRDLVDEWCRQTTIGDCRETTQPPLQRAMDSSWVKSRLSIYALPATYGWIDGRTSPQKEGFTKEDVVIYHHQASRKHNEARARRRQ